MSIALIILLLMTASTNCTGQQSTDIMTGSPSSWAKLQISPDTLVSMDYSNFGIDIYEHANNHKPTTPLERYKYFFAPIALLDHKSAVSFFNNVTKQPEMRFRIEMWNPTLKNEVVKYLSIVLKRQIDDHQVQVIPLENVILTSTSSSTSFSLSTDWKPIRQHQHLSFTLNCFVEDYCDQLAAEMRSDPEQFDHFKLLFSLSSQTSQIKQTVISIDSITSGGMTSKLLQKFGQEKEEVYLTAGDEKRMLTETATQIRLDTFDDSSDVVSSRSEKEIYQMVKDLLVTSRTTITKESDKMWESVFWNDDNYRPDKTTKTLNDIFGKVDVENQKKMANSFTNTNKFGNSVEIGKSELATVKHSYETDFSRHGLTTEENVNKFYRETKDHVEWDGSQFVPKPMQLSRINLAKFKDTQSFQDNRIAVSYKTAVLSTPINFVPNSHLVIPDEWQHIKNELLGVKRELEETRMNLTNAISFLQQELITQKKTISSVDGIPASCADLQTNGEIVDGFYMIKGKKEIDVVYCTFQSNGTEIQKWIGHIQVQSTPVYFYVQRSSPMSTPFSRISYNIERVNVGGAINSSGIFTAPVDGTYFFCFTGLASFPSASYPLYLEIGFYLNDEAKGRTRVGEAYTFPDQMSPLSLQATYVMKKGNQLEVRTGQMTEGVSLFDDPGSRTHFTGWLLSEDISQRISL